MPSPPPRSSTHYIHCKQRWLSAVHEGVAPLAGIEEIRYPLLPSP
ncbi:unnamed protein product, partial [Linum tenue]